jgi:tyrosinase
LILTPGYDWFYSNQVVGGAFMNDSLMHSRRRVLVQGAVIGAGIIASNVSGIVAIAQAQQPPERRSLLGLPWNDPIIAAYRDAVGQMKQKPASDKLSWASLADVHGTDPNTYHFCPHGNWYFLPWHRAYVLTCERAVRQLTGHNDFAMPYWDWTANPTMPEVFLTATNPDGKKNWLYVDDEGFGTNWKRTWPANRPMPVSQVGAAVLQEILNTTDYEEFGTSRPAGQDSLDQAWIIAENQGIQGTLEARPHNMVHNNIGGWMPTAVSSRDPIFFMHHCNIDRIWALWNSLGNQNAANSLWTDMQFKNNFYFPDGSDYSPIVKELYVPEALGYTYNLAAPAAAIAAPSSAVLALQSRLQTVFAMPNPAGPGIKNFSASPRPQATATAESPFEVELDVDASALEAVAHRSPVSSGAELLSFAAARERRASGPRSIAIIRDVVATKVQSTEFRIFLGDDRPTSQTPITAPNYVGSFGLFVHGEHTTGQGPHNANPSFAVDLTGPIQRVYGAMSPRTGRIKLQILPVASGGAGEVGTATASKVEVVILGT